MVTLVLATMLWRHHAAMPEICGVVEAVRVDVSAVEDGLLLPSVGPPPKLFDVVRSGEVIARLDPSAAEAELDALRNDLAEISSEQLAESFELKLDAMDIARDHRREYLRLVVQYEKLQLDLLDRTTKLEAARVERMRLESNLRFIEAAFEQEISTEMEYDNVRLLYAEAVKLVEESEKSKQQSERILAQAKERLDALAEPLEPELETMLAPFRGAIAAARARVRALEVRIARLEIRAPITGTICAITAWPGQAVAANQPIMTIAAEEGRYVVGYVRSYQRIEPREGATVRVRRNTGPVLWTQATVDRVGPQVEPIPAMLLRDPKTPEWGVAVRIPVPSTLRARPGERIDIVYDDVGHDVEESIDTSGSPNGSAPQGG